MVYPVKWLTAWKDSRVKLINHFDKIKKLNKRLVTFLAVSLIAITAIATRFALGAGSGVLIVTVNDNDIQVGENVVVTVTANSGTEPVNVARARVSFDPTKWQYLSEDYTGVPFPNRTPDNPPRDGPNYHEVTGYTIDGPYPSGTFVIGRFTLKSIAATTGTTPLDIVMSESELYSNTNGDPFLGTATNTAVTINNPPDVKDPSVPVVTGASHACSPTSQVTVSWNASTDTQDTSTTPPTPASGMSKYYLRRGTSTTNIKVVNHTGASSYSTVDNTSTFTAGTTYQYKIIAVDVAGNESDPGIAPNVTIPNPACVDSTPPSNVTSLDGTYSSTPAPNFDLTWTRATDNISVHHYKIWVNGVEQSVEVPQSASTPIVYEYTPAVAPTPGDYNFQVKAVDASGNYSANFSNTKTIPVTDTSPPDAPGNFSVQHQPGPPKSNRLTWTKPNDNVATTGYFIYRNGTTPTHLVTTINNGNIVSYDDTQAAALIAGSSHIYIIRAFDAANNISAQATTGLQVPDTEAPAPAPTIKSHVLQVTPQKITFELNTPLPTDASSFTYNLYQGATGCTTLRQQNITLDAQNKFEYTPSTPLAYGTYNFRITAVDTASTPNETACSNAHQVPIPDTEAPTPVPSIVSHTLSSSPQSITFTINPSTDNSGVAPRYRLYQDGGATPVLNNITLSSNTFVYTPSTPLSAGAHTFTLKAFDGASPPNETVLSSPYSVPVPDTTKPNPIDDLQGVKQSSPAQVQLTWTNPGDNVVVTNYRVSRVNPDGTISALGTTTSTSFNDTSSLTQVGDYVYTVYAQDAASNESDPSNPVTITNTDDQEPTPPANFVATYQESPARIDLTWTASTDNIAVTGYRIYRSDVGSTPIATVAGSVLAYTDTTLLSPGTYTYYVTAIDDGLLESDPSNNDDATVPVPPNNCPTTPTGLNATFQPSPAQINISWTGSTDSDGSVVRYEVWRDGVWVKNVSHPTTTTSDNSSGSLTPGNHTYVIYAVDNDNCFSAASTPDTVTVPDTEKPTTPSNLSVVRQTEPSVRNRITWTASTDNVAIDHYEVYRDGTALANRIAANVASTATSFNDNSAAGQVPGIHTYTVIAVDTATPTKNQSDHQNPAASLTVPDVTPPAAITDLSASVQTDPNQVVLTWSAPTDNVGVIGYRIFRDGTQIDTTGLTTYNDTAELSIGNHTYTVRAYDGATPPNVSGPSNAETVNIGDYEDPTPPANFTATFNSNPYGVSMNWDEATDNSGVIDHYNIYRDGTYINQVTGLTYTDTTVLSYGDHTYHVTAVDGSERESDPSESATISAPDMTAPTAPSNLAASYQSSPEQINLTWDASTDSDTGVERYEIYREGETEPIGSTNATQYVHSGPFGAGEYRYVVYAIDGAEAPLGPNRSDASNEAVVSVPDTEAPTAPGGLSGEFVNPDKIELDWQASTDNVAVDHYSIKRDGVEVGTSPASQTSFTDGVAGLPTGDYTYTVTAFDTASPTPLESDPSNQVTVTIPEPDNEPPTQPTNLTANYDAGAQRTALNWTAATDNTGVVGYSVVMDGTIEVGTTASTSFNHTSYLAPGNHTYQVFAYDARDHQSPGSNIVTITVPAEDRGAVEEKYVFYPSRISDDTESVEYYVDDELVATETEEPFSTVIDTTELPDGEHCLTTKSTNSNGKQNSNKDCSLVVDNRSGLERLIPLRSRDRALLGMALGMTAMAGGFYLFYYKRHHH
jgi:hypothetical protein